MKIKSFEKDYSSYYDLFYSDKNYEAESQYFLSKAERDIKNILELGCGTGNYSEYFIKKGKTVYGVEISKSMLNIANKRFSNNFISIHSDIENFKIDKKFKIAYSLFHVFSYLTENNKILNTLKNINNHLEKGGLFIFDYWYTNGVLNLKPETKIRKIENKKIKATRLSTPNIVCNKNLVEVNFEYFIEDKETKKIFQNSEKHNMRHFSLPELELFANLSGFEILNSEELISKKFPSDKVWALTSIFKKL